MGNTMAILNIDVSGVMESHQARLVCFEKKCPKGEKRLRKHYKLFLRLVRGCHRHRHRHLTSSLANGPALSVQNCCPRYSKVHQNEGNNTGSKLSHLILTFRIRGVAKKGGIDAIARTKRQYVADSVLRFLIQKEFIVGERRTRCGRNIHWFSLRHGHRIAINFQLLFFGRRLASFCENRIKPFGSRRETRIIIQDFMSISQGGLYQKHDGGPSGTSGVPS
mmetsp:Transcript_28050/g.36201  ORF Transcript_28050/g.36201 Transcript_28050/m.36201 type:complete len:221 (+) Transcript_28050:90-752(+)